MIQTPCPYCNHPEMSRPSRSARPYGKCPKCGRKSRAEISDTVDGKKTVRYVATSEPSRYVYQASRIRPDQKAFLADKNASEVIRDALEEYMERRVG